jgi:hypothetical protein
MEESVGTADGMTAERLPEPPRSRFALGRMIGSTLVSLLPLVVLAGFFVTNTDVFMPDDGPTVRASYYPAVSIAFVGTQAEPRELLIEGEVTPRHSASLRAKRRSEVISVAANVGDFVTEGQPLCRLRLTDGMGVDVLTAPMNGQVGAVHALGGTIIEKGRPCLTIADTSSSKVAGSLKPRHAEILRAGDPAAVKVSGNTHNQTIEVIYPEADGRPYDNREFEVMLPKVPFLKASEKAAITLSTQQVMPTLVPQRALVMSRERGLSVRIVHGQGPTGVIETLPVRIIAAARSGFYVEGLPLSARVVVDGRDRDMPKDGTTVRIGRVT